MKEYLVCHVSKDEIDAVIEFVSTRRSKYKEMVFFHTNDSYIPGFLLQDIKLDNEDEIAPAVTAYLANLFFFELPTNKNASIVTVCSKLESVRNAYKIMEKVNPAFRCRNGSVHCFDSINKL